MWRPIFELFDVRTSITSESYRGRLVDVSDTTSACVVEYTLLARAATLPWERRGFHLRDVVLKCTSFRIVVDVVDGTVVRGVVDVDDEAFRMQMGQRRRVDGEVHIVELLASTWKDLAPIATREPAPPCEEMTTVDDDDLMPHQRLSVEWMCDMERRVKTLLQYEGNLRINDEWFVDTEEARLTRSPSWREAHTCGGILGDWPGAGKTATALVACVRMPRDEGAVIGDEGVQTSGTLIVLPLNLHRQWLDEARRVVPTARVVSLICTRDVRAITLGEVIDADIVMTTTEFLSASRAYQECVDDAVETGIGVDRRAARTRGALATWARSSATRESMPIIEALEWHRIVVDEVHEAFASARRAKTIRALRGRWRWGISATPTLDRTALQEACYWLLRRDKAHHPNLLRGIMDRCVRVVLRPASMSYDRNLQRVEASAAERAAIDEMDVRDIEGVVRLCTRVVTTDDIVAHEPKDLVDLLGGDDVPVDFAKAQIDGLVNGDEQCPICLDEACGVVLACGHTFCRPCLTIAHVTHAAKVCPTCRRQVSLEDARGVLVAGSKATTIADAMVALNERAILFVQWRETLRGVRSVLRGRGLRCFALEGNAAQRARNLADFATSERGVLLLSLNDSFAGLHLPHVRHVVFTHAVVGRAERVEDIEAQAVARCLRRGQTQRVFVHSFVVADSVEERVWRHSHTTPSVDA